MDFFIYVVCLGVGLLFTLVSVFFGHLFGGHEAHVDGSGGHAEAGADSSDMPGVSVLSPTVIAAFITAFGGLGIIFHQIPSTSSAWISAPLAAVGALAIASAIVMLLRQLFLHTQSSSESRLASVVGMLANVVSPIPAAGVGEIAYVQAGTRYTAPAREETGKPVGSGQAVKIVRVVGAQFYVQAV